MKQLLPLRRSSGGLSSKKRGLCLSLIIAQIVGIRGNIDDTSIGLVCQAARCYRGVYRHGRPTLDVYNRRGVNTKTTKMTLAMPTRIPNYNSRLWMEISVSDDQNIPISYPR